MMPGVVDHQLPTMMAGAMISGVTSLNPLPAMMMAGVASLSMMVGVARLGPLPAMMPGVVNHQLPTMMAGMVSHGVGIPGLNTQTLQQTPAHPGHLMIGSRTATGQKVAGTMCQTAGWLLDGESTREEKRQRSCNESTSIT